jgi:hypothetical protein
MRAHRWLLLIGSLVVFLCGHLVIVAAPATTLECGCDVNRDGVVNLLDLVAVSRRYGVVSSAQLPPGAREDTNGDGAVNLADLVCVSVNYGRGVTWTGPCCGNP